MATLIAVYSGIDHRGRRICVGRCDAKCYLSKHDNCDCICGGKNHKKGLDRAVENTRDSAEEWLLKYAKAKGLGTNYSSAIGRCVRQKQLSLFDCSTLTAQVLGS
jgi:hypothetical protein